MWFKEIIMLVIIAGLYFALAAYIEKENKNVAKMLRKRYKDYV